MSPTDQGTGAGHLPQVTDQKAILVPMHLGAELQLAPTSFSDLEDSSPGCVLREVNLGTWVRGQEVEKEREENPINISIAKGWCHILYFFFFFGEVISPVSFLDSLILS